MEKFLNHFWRTGTQDSSFIFQQSPEGAGRIQGPMSFEGGEYAPEARPEPSVDNICDRVRECDRPCTRMDVRAMRRAIRVDEQREVRAADARRREARRQWRQRHFDLSHALGGAGGTAEGTRERRQEREARQAVRALERRQDAAWMRQEAGRLGLPDPEHATMEQIELAYLEEQQGLDEAEQARQEQAIIEREAERSPAGRTRVARIARAEAVGLPRTATEAQIRVAETEKRRQNRANAIGIPDATWTEIRRAEALRRTGNNLELIQTTIQNERRIAALERQQHERVNGCCDAAVAALRDAAARCDRTLATAEITALEGTPVLAALTPVPSTGDMTFSEKEVPVLTAENTPAPLTPERRNGRGGGGRRARGPAATPSARPVATTGEDLVEWRSTWEEYKVQPNDSLRGIARKLLQNEELYTRLQVVRNGKLLENLPRVIYANDVVRYHPIVARGRDQIALARGVTEDTPTSIVHEERPDEEATSGEPPTLAQR